MNDLHKSGEFESSDDAFEYLINARQDEARKKRWAKELGMSPKVTSVAKNTERKRFRLFAQIASAAAVLLIVGFFLFHKETEPLKVYASDLLKETKINMSYGSSSRGKSKDASTEKALLVRNQLASLLLDSDYSQALGRFRELEKMLPLSIEDKYFFAIALLNVEDEDHTKAIRLLSDVVDDNDHNLENALWLRSLAYAMTDNRGMMKADLDMLKSISTKSNERIMDLLSKY